MGRSDSNTFKHEEQPVCCRSEGKGGKEVGVAEGAGTAWWPEPPTLIRCFVFMERLFKFA